jgi:SAM-dependent methyltransferase
VRELDRELHNGLPLADRNRYIEKAWRMLPQFRRPDVLDVGCGPGGPTLKLARLSGGRVTGLDTSRRDLARLTKRARAENLSDRVCGVHGSMMDMTFPRHSFDIVWSEGSIFVIGFERGLREWRWLVRPGGCLVVHDMCWLRPDPPREIAEYWRALYPGINTVDGSIAVVDTCDYDLIGWFTLPEDAWWDLYYGPLQDRVDVLRHKYAGDDSSLGVLEREQRDIDLYRRHRRWYGSAYFVMQAAGE